MFQRTANIDTGLAPRGLPGILQAAQKCPCDRVAEPPFFPARSANKWFGRGLDAYDSLSESEALEPKISQKLAWINSHIVNVSIGYSKPLQTSTRLWPSVIRPMLVKNFCSTWRSKLPQPPGQLVRTNLPKSTRNTRLFAQTQLAEVSHMSHGQYSQCPELIWDFGESE